MSEREFDADVIIVGGDLPDVLQQSFLPMQASPLSY